MRLKSRIPTTRLRKNRSNGFVDRLTNDLDKAFRRRIKGAAPLMQRDRQVW